ncbi:MAG: hypothetical protein LBU60_02020 [Clostridiales bacterium]|jgi:hypothetical protein|nr:hypothetical protein [Clostridiales bacterium]
MQNISTAKETIVFEPNKENEVEKSHRNALRFMLNGAINGKDSLFGARGSTNELYHYMFGSQEKNKARKLFLDSKNNSTNAEIKPQKEVAQFFSYLTGYREAANVIIMDALIKGNDESKNNAIFPACFLYRQYLELSLKDLYLYYSKDTDEQKSKFLKNTNHLLLSVWSNQVKPMIETLMNENNKIELEGYTDKQLKDFNLKEKERMQNIENYINEFHNMDVDSMLFRYPINKDRKPSHKSVKKICLVNLMQKINEIESFISFISALLDSTRPEFLTMLKVDANEQ